MLSTVSEGGNCWTRIQIRRCSPGQLDLVPILAQKLLDDLHIIERDPPFTHPHLILTAVARHKDKVIFPCQ